MDTVDLAIADLWEQLANVYQDEHNDRRVRLADGEGEHSTTAVDSALYAIYRHFLLRDGDWQPYELN